MPRIGIMSHRGDDLFAEYGKEANPDELRAIAERFNEQRAKGFRAFDREVEALI